MDDLNCRCPPLRMKDAVKALLTVCRHQHSGGNRSFVMLLTGPIVSRVLKCCMLFACSR